MKQITILPKNYEEQKEFIASAMQEKNKLTTSIIKYISKYFQTSVASFSDANVIARYGKISAMESF